MDDENTANVKVEDMAAYLIKHHADQLRTIILSAHPRLHYPLYVE